MSAEYSSWLKAMQNGALGEARAKAFLMNRFWVLERSVDINGADYLIQRRITRQNNYNNTAPCLGIVQVKFFENNNTPMYISKEYVVSEDGKHRNDFFLLAFTGDEDSSEIYYLDSQVISEFDEKSNSNKPKYYLTGAKLIKGGYKVTSNRLTLNRMEDSLSHTNFLKNRSFIMSKFPSETIDTTVVMPVFKEPIDNWWGNIPKEFEKVKKSAISLMNEISELYERIRDVAVETLPMEAMLKAELINRDFGQSYYGSWGIEIANNLFDKNLYYVSKEHLEKVALLKKDGILDSFISIKDYLKDKIFQYLSKSLPIDSNTIHKVVIEFNMATLQIVGIDQSFIEASEYFGVSIDLNEYGHIEVPEYEGVKIITKNKFEYFWLAGRCYVKDNKSNELKCFYSDLDLPILWQCMDKIFEMKYYEN